MLMIVDRANRLNIVATLLISLLMLTACNNSVSNEKVDKIPAVLKTDSNQSNLTIPNDNNSQKYKIIHQMSSDATLTFYDTQAKHSDRLNHLYTYANDELKTTIALAENELLKNPQSDTNCRKSIAILAFSPEQALAIGDTYHADFVLLDDGRVKSDITVNYKDANKKPLLETRYYSFECSNGRCQITDVYDTNEESAIHNIYQYCI